MDNVVAVIMPKGGVGKTTTAVNLAAALVRGGYRVLMVDNDWQGSATVHAGLKEPEDLEQTLADVLTGRIDAAAAIRRTTGGYDLLPGNGELANVDLDLLALGEAGIYRLRDVLAEVAGDYDVVLIDNEPGMHVRALGALAAAHYCLAPVSADYLSLKPLKLFLQVLRSAQARYKAMPTHRVGVIVTRFDWRQSQAVEVVEIVKRIAPEAGLDWLTTIVPERAAHRKAAAAGSSVAEVAGAGIEDLTAVYDELAKKVIEW